MSKKTTTISVSQDTQNEIKAYCNQQEPSISLMQFTGLLVESGWENFKNSQNINFQTEDEKNVNGTD